MLNLKVVLSFATLCLIASLFGVGQAHASCAGATIGDPLNALAGTSWAFQTIDANNDGSIGYFILTVQPPTAKNPNSTGILNGKLTSVSNNGQVQRLAQLTGAYQVNLDCTSGTLVFTETGTNYQYAFVNMGAELLLANAGENMPNYSNGQFAGSHGKAVLLPGAPQCPAGVSPNSLFVGNWFFKTHDVGGNSEIGTFTASITPGSDVTVLNGALTSSEGNHVITTQEQFTGNFQVSSDCSGGVWTHSTQTPHFEFVFAGSDKILYIDLNAGDGYIGTAVMAH